MKYFLISSLMVLTLILRAGEIDIISMAKSGKITESREQLNKLPAGIKKSIITYKLAEYCFDQGELKTAEELLKEFMATADSVEYRKKLSGYTRRSKTMLEYISRYGDANVTKTLKKAQALVEQRECSNETLLDNISVFSGRAVNWKERGIAEYDQLIQLIQKLLDRIEDKGNTEVAVKVALLRCRLLRLEGDNRQCLEILEQCLRYYYPETLKHYYRPQPYPAVARRLLREMGEQFATLAEKSNNTNEKIDYYTRAAASFVKSTIRLPLDNDEFNIAKEHILRYREALRLLGYKLNIDAKFLNQSASPELDIYRGMLEQKRFVAAVKAMQNLIVKNRDAGKDISPELNLLYARALCGAEQYTQAVEICDKLSVGQDLPQDTVDIIMDMAYTARGKGAENEALKFFVRLKKLVPSHPDRKMYLQDCAALAIKLEQYEIAAECFLELASIHNNPDAKALALFNAAQSQFKLHDYSRAIETGKQTLALPGVSTQLKHKIGFLIGQSAMMMAKNQTEDSEKSHYLAIATEQFNSLCNDSTLDEKLKQQALLLGGIASYYDKK
ncbi:MAG: hypothetical protein JXR78_08135, partial [Victivallales bacterium]|nr:hypothetical protein [Victivallales bacterium]